MADCLAVQRPTLPPSLSHICAKWRIEWGEEAEEERKRCARSANFLLLFVRWMGHWTENDRTGGGASRQGKLPTDVSGLLEREGAAMMLWLDVSYD